MEIIATIALALGASWCAGINLYATVAVLGLMHRYSGFTLPPGMEALAHDFVLWPAIVMYALEFFADKVPAVDTTWDAIQTFFRVPAGAVLAATALGDVPAEFSVLAAMIGGGLAFTSHTAKATGRIALHGTGGSIATPVVSLGEDGLVVATIALVATHPVLSLFLLAAMMICAYFLLRFFWSLTRKLAKWLFGRGRRPTTPPPPPALPA